MTLGEKLKEHRIDTGLSLGKAAELLNVSIEELTSWENNTATPSTKSLMALSLVYDVHLEELE